MVGTTLIETFLCDVFDVFDLNEIENLTRVINMKEQILDYNKLFTQIRVVRGAAFALCWQHLLGGVQPSRYDLWDFHTDFKQDAHIGIDSMIKWIAQRTFLRYVSGHPMIAQRVTSLKWQTPDNMREFLIDKLATRYGKVHNGEATLLQAYKTIINGIDFKNEAHSINHGSLMSLNPMTGFYVDTPRSHTLTKGACCALDCARYVIARDVQLAYKTFDKVVVFHSPDEYTHVWPRTGKDNEIVHRVFTHKHRQIADYCIPRWFQQAIVYHPTPAQNVPPYCLRKQLDIVEINDSKNQPTANKRILCTQSIGLSVNEYLLPVHTNADITRELLKLHIKHECPIAHPSNTTQHHALVAMDRIVRLHAKLIKTRPNYSSLGNTRKHAVVLVDNRRNVFSTTAIHITMDNLKRDAWDLVIVTSKQNIEWYKERVDGAIIITDERLEYEPFDIETYNVVMKDADFWKRFTHYERVLIIQDDGMIVRPGLESRFIQYDYVGSPWIHSEANSEIIMMNKGLLVGNGGLSLRNPRIMQEICTRFAKEGNRLFNNQLQPIPEDVFFSHCIATKLSGKATTPLNREATFFATEQVENLQALGFHKFWAYHPLSYVLRYFEPLCA